MTRVSCGICRAPDGRILICRRGEGRNHAHLWEFPGGKQESGETAEACLKRELMEELSLPVEDVRLILTEQGEGLTFDFLTCRMAGRPVRTEHEALDLAFPRQMLPLPFCPADTDVVRRLALNDPPLRHFFWDFDGTLADSYPAMVRAFLRGARTLNASADAGRVLALMKDSLGACAQAVAAENGLRADDLVAAFHRAEAEEPVAGIPAVAGIPEALRALKALGGRHYLVTHRGGTAFDWLRAHHLEGLIADAVTAEDGFPRKPAPDSLLSLIRRHRVNPAAAVMIGDRPLDTTAGRAAGLLGCLLDTEGRFPACPCDLRAASAASLPGLLCPQGLQV